MKNKDLYYDEALLLHKENPVVDAHIDLAAEIYARQKEGERNIIEKYYLDNLKTAGINILVSSIYIESEMLPGKGSELVLSQTGALLRDIEPLDEVRIVKSRDEIERVIKENKIGIILYMEGLDIISRDINMLRALYAMGIRGASLTWSRRNYLAEGCCKAGEYENIRGGLTKLGISAVKLMEELGMFLDVSHLNDDGFEDIKSAADKAFIASHSNSRSVHMNYRNLTDKQIETICKRGGVIGINAYKDIVGADPYNNPIPKICEHIKHIISIAGYEHAGFGLDLCDGCERAASGMKFEPLRGDCLVNHTELIDVSAELLRQGFGSEVVKNIIGRNFVNYFCKIFN